MVCLIKITIIRTLVSKWEADRKQPDVVYHQMRSLQVYALIFKTNHLCKYLNDFSWSTTVYSYMSIFCDGFL